MQGPTWPQGRRVGGWAGPEAEGCDGHPGHGDIGLPWLQHPGELLCLLGDPDFLLCVHIASQGMSRQGASCLTLGRGTGGWVCSPGAAHCCFSTEHGAPALLPYQFHMEEIEGFRYRCRVSGPGRGSGFLWDGRPSSPSVLTLMSIQDAMRSVTKQAIREARLKEIKEELLHSERLKVRRHRAQCLGLSRWGPCREPAVGLVGDPKEDLSLTMVMS